MDIKSYNLEDYKKFQLTKSTVTSQFTDLVEFCLISEDESAKHSFHKFYINNWSEHPDELFNTLSEVMSTSLVPINVRYEHDVVSFYSSNLNLVFRIIKSDFKFVYENVGYHIDCVTFNHSSSVDFFGRKCTIDEIVRNIVMLKFNSENNELDLSEFCKDYEFTSLKIYFYKIELLAYFKELMLKMGREVEILNFSKNKLKYVPQKIINFFIKGKLVGLNVSRNDLNTMAQVRCTSLIEKLWLEGNPLCNEYKEEPYLYVKQAVTKFPRLQWLDDVPVNRSGLIFPFWRTFLRDDDAFTRNVVDKFLVLYFSHYDCKKRNNIMSLYHGDCMMSISTGFKPEQEAQMPHFENCGRNFLQPMKRKKAYYGVACVRSVLVNLPWTTHDPNSFMVDVVRSDPINLTLIVDGVFKEHQVYPEVDRLVQFRRTFVLLPRFLSNDRKAYNITNDMLTVTNPSEELAESCFQTPVRNLNSLMLVNPASPEIEAVTLVFMHETSLKKRFASEWLRAHNWDIKKALLDFCTHLRLDHIPRDHFKDPNKDDDDDEDMDIKPKLEAAKQKLELLQSNKQFKNI